MTPLDWIIVVFAAGMIVAGYGRGLVVGGLALVGFGIGAFAGSRLGPMLLSEGQESPWAPLMALTCALLLGAFTASVLEVLGIQLRRALRGPLGVLDGIGGALLVGALALGIAWVLGAVALQTPGARELREPIQRSLILRELNAVLPPSGPVLRALARFDPLPRISGPDADVSPPDAAIARDPEVRAAGESIVRVLGTACGLGVQGTGWIARDGVIVTNAHVVAGQDDTVVDVGGDGGDLEAEPIWFDVRNDVALLSVPDAAGPPALRLSDDPSEGTSGAVLGFPENGSLDVRAARLGPTRSAVSQDAYGRGPVQRSITAFRALVRSGNSGGPVVDGDGRVIATVFAASTGSGAPTGFGVPNDVVADALASASGPVDTGPCVR
ncbi:MAG TPA: MarP family serine protease [Thermoleophilaceae bacterium]|nr:MarP family serine protease [Thermoleophilaceae bacterium]